MTYCQEVKKVMQSLTTVADAIRSMQTILPQLSPQPSPILLLVNFGTLMIGQATNKQLINLSKTKIMIICRLENRAKSTFPEPITGIEQIHTIKLLGVTFSDNLSFAPHIDNTLCSV